ncbi:carboxymuconolactone decarboxylase family protein [Pseudodesulfovibrio indicus]|uniref:carboxymuconolactone decarboxylase family protein n=1 Tax=Pseudodesulfovibrio indicus TaxID=1716143 RepID=UPI00292F632E|nr:carboxymuconolactone decarboxylase family protein [Pseudodesulfovibrio indicus]
MLENQTEVRRSIERNWGAFKRAMPELTEVHEAHTMEVYKDGEVSGKHKRLMALVGALVSGCRGCILFQTNVALELGATKGEILESCAVAVSLGGTMASSSTARVMEYLIEQGVME